MTGHVATATTQVEAVPDRVWQALTDPDQVASYMMGSRVESDWRPGSTITWSGEWQGREYQDKGQVLQAEPGRLLEVTHYSPLTGQDDIPENYHTVRYELEPSGTGTTVRLTQDGCADEAQARQFSQNWQGMLDGLKKVAEA
ncbi:SRPBCC family protein [Pedococcus sp. 5OH_020]|uniref:SRPBCC family protein n=1 Tax=Pedococcus sp. 5OH_020 TaxID=2989814 RepID=UPI0022E9C823|nr:SRPBCC domain-containing protein [Pedococcus sp. 5OH_020]